MSIKTRASPWVPGFGSFGAGGDDSGSDIGDSYHPPMSQFSSHPSSLVPGPMDFQPGHPSGSHSPRPLGTGYQPSMIAHMQEHFVSMAAAHNHKKRPVPGYVLQYVLQHYAEAQTLANRIGHGVTAAEVLAISGNESRWGNLDPALKKEDWSLAQYGNFFGLHGDGPAGTYYTKKNHTPTPKYPVENGFMLSDQEFVDRVLKRNLITAEIGTDPKAFFTVLNKSGLYAAGDKTYPAFMVCTPDKGCPGYPPGTRGPYTLVTEAIEELKNNGKL